MKLEALVHTHLYLTSSERIGASSIKTIGTLKLNQARALGSAQWENKVKSSKRKNFFTLLESEKSNIIIDKYFQQANSVNYDYSKVVDYADSSISSQVEFTLIVRVP